MMNIWKAFQSKHLLTLGLLGWATGGALAQDCNSNGIPDDQELTETWVMTGRAGGRELAQFTFVDAPQALADVPLLIEARVLLEFDEEQADIYVNGDFIGSIFDEDCGSFNCANPFRCNGGTQNPSAQETIMIPASIWNNARIGNNGGVPIEVDYIQSQFGGRCNGPHTLFTAEILTTTDCDGDGILNECEVDCDEDGRPDECQTDSDGDGVIDPCDECEGSDDSIDEDQDGVIDGCDQCLGEDDRVDCNNDGTPDCLQRVQTWSTKLMSKWCANEVSPGPTDSDHVVPPAIGDVRIFNDFVPAYDINGADQYYSVYINGTEALRMWEGEWNCELDEVFTIPAATWNSLRRADATMTLEIHQSPGSCDGPESCGGRFLFNADFKVVYEFDADANGDGYLDICAPRCNPTGPDSDADGVPDACDDCPDTVPGLTHVDIYGCPLVAVPADIDFDGDVDQDDYTGFFVCISEPNSAPISGCEAYDYGVDGDVDLHDFLALQDAVSGTDVVAELASMGGFVPHFVAIDYFLGSGMDPTWFDGNRFCRKAHGTNMASIQGTTEENEQRSLFDEMTAIMTAYPNDDAWFGLRFDGGALDFVWEGRPRTIIGDTTNWANGGRTPSAFEMIGSPDDPFYAFLSARDNHEWSNTADEPTEPLPHNPQMFLCDLPELTVGSEEHIAPVALNISIEANGSNTVEILPGGFIDFEVIGQLDAATTQGLAGFAFDLNFNDGSIFIIEAPAGDIQNFVYPAGYSPLGFEGKRQGRRILQIGGGQNTMGNTDIFGPTGTVITGVGHTPTVLATARVVPPRNPGVYTLSLTNLVANTINPDQSGPVWTCEPALPGSNTGLTITVIDCPDADNDGVCNVNDICDGGNDLFDVDGDGVPNACDIEPMLRFEDVVPGTYSSYEEIGFIVETDTTFEIGSEPNDGFDLQYLETETSITIRSLDGRPFTYGNVNVSEVGLTSGFSRWQFEATAADGTTIGGTAMVFPDPKINTFAAAQSEFVELTYTSQTPGSILRFDNFVMLPNCPGDINRDRVIDLSDLSILLSDFGRSGAQASDINGDGSVDLSDLAQLLSLFGQSCD